MPWNGRYLIGTTDIRYEGDLDYVSASEEEIQYLLDETNYVIPAARLSRDDVLYTYAGVRPCPISPKVRRGASPGSHVVFDHAKGGSAAGGKITRSDVELPQVGGLLSIIGGKLTTYLNLSRQTVDVVFEKLDRKAPKSRSRKVPLPGSETSDFEAFAAGFKSASTIPEVLSGRLLKLYGVRAAEVLKIGEDDPELLTPLSSTVSVETALIGAEVIWAFREEMAQTLSDVLLRRSMAGYGPRVALDVVDAAAEVAVKHLGWERSAPNARCESTATWIKRSHHPQRTQGSDAPHLRTHRQILSGLVRRKRHSYKKGARHQGRILKEVGKWVRSWQRRWRTGLTCRGGSSRCGGGFRRARPGG